MKKFAKKLKNIYFLSFTIPVALMLGIFILRGIFPCGNNSFMFSDMYHQYVPFLTEFWNKLHNGESLAFSWNAGIGSNFVGIFGYYLASPFNWLSFIFPESLLIEFMSYMIVIKIGLCGLTFTYYLSKRFETRDLRIVWFSVFYAMSGFLAAYSWNHMWMDGIWLTPLIILGLDELILKGKCRLYCIALAASILTNYYLSILICIFLVLYFVMQLFTNKLTLRLKAAATLRFGVTSALAGGMASMILIPVFYAMHVTDFHEISFPKKIEFYFNALEMIARHVPMIPTERGLDHWPNIYCGVFVFILIPVYFFHKKILLRQKIGHLLLLAVFLLSFSMNTLNFIWHGLNYPDSLPARQSFLYIFILLSMCFEACYKNAENGTINKIFGVVTGLLLLAACGIFVDTDGLTVWVMTCAWIFLAGYLILSVLFNRKLAKCLKHNFGLRKIALLGKWFILLLVCIEAVLNMEDTSVRPVQRDYYLNKKTDYEELLKEIPETNDFYRLDSFSQMTKNDGTLVGYPSASIFSSTINGNVKDYYKKLGMGGSKVSYYYAGSTPLAAALMGVRYSFSEKESMDSELYRKIATHEKMTLYENEITLPVGFLLDSETFTSASEEMVTGQGNALIEQNRLGKVLGEEDYIYSSLARDEITKTTNTVTIVPLCDGHLYGVVNSKPDGTVYLAKGDEEKVELSNFTNDYVLDLGYFKEGEKFCISTEEEELPKLQLYRQDNEILRSVIDKLGERPLKVEGYTSNSFSGSIEADIDGYVVLSIASEPGWQIIVDDVVTECEKFADTMIAIPVTKGTHTIKMKYSIQGVGAGIAISAVSILIFILIYCRKRKMSEKKCIQEADKKVEETKEEIVEVTE